MVLRGVPGARLRRLAAPLGRRSPLPAHSPVHLPVHPPEHPSVPRPSSGPVPAAADTYVMDSYLFRAGVSGFARGRGVL